MSLHSEATGAADAPTSGGESTARPRTQKPTVAWSQDVNAPIGSNDSPDPSDPVSKAETSASTTFVLSDDAGGNRNGHRSKSKRSTSSGEGKSGDKKSSSLVSKSTKQKNKTSGTNAGENGLEGDSSSSSDHSGSGTDSSAERRFSLSFGDSNSNGNNNRNGNRYKNDYTSQGDLRDTVRSERSRLHRLKAAIHEQKKVLRKRARLLEEARAEWKRDSKAVEKLERRAGKR